MEKIVIVGGGIIGSSIAYYLARAGAPVTVVEPDPTYEFAATPRSVGGVRFLHDIRENVEMSLFGREVFTGFAAQVQGAAVAFDPAWRTVGYLYMVSDAESARQLEHSAAMQRACGVEVSLLDRDALRARYPSFRFQDVIAAAWSPQDGQIDPHAALMGYRRAAEGNGAVYLKDKVVGIGQGHGRVSGVALQSGATLNCDIVVNAANCWAPEICEMAGIKAPIYPMRREQFFFKIQDPIESIPVMREACGFALRPERDGYIVARTRPDEKKGFNWTQDHDRFENDLWPGLVERSSAFEALRLQNAWVGHYDMNEIDGNPIIGECGALRGFHMAAGFSGHGLQHAPAVGRGMAELLTTGRYETIDLGPFSYQRVIEGRPLLDKGPRA